MDEQTIRHNYKRRLQILACTGIFLAGSFFGASNYSRGKKIADLELEVRRGLELSERFKELDKNYAKLDRLYTILLTESQEAAKDMKAFVEKIKNQEESQKERHANLGKEYDTLKEEVMESTERIKILLTPKIENIIGESKPEKFYNINGQRVYLEIDGKPVEEYWRGK